MINVWTSVDGQRVAKLAQLVSAGSKKENALLLFEKPFMHTFVLIAAPFSPLPPTNPSTHTTCMSAFPMPWLGLSNPCQNVSV